VRQGSDYGIWLTRSLGGTGGRATPGSPCRFCRAMRTWPKERLSARLTFLNSSRAGSRCSARAFGLPPGPRPIRLSAPLAESFQAPSACRAGSRPTRQPQRAWCVAMRGPRSESRMRGRRPTVLVRRCRRSPRARRATCRSGGAGSDATRRGSGRVRAVARRARESRTAIWPSACRGQALGGLG